MMQKGIKFKYRFYFYKTEEVELFAKPLSLSVNLTYSVSDNSTLGVFLIKLEIPNDIYYKINLLKVSAVIARKSISSQD